MRMPWVDRNVVWRQVEVALVELQTGESREGTAGGGGVWRTRMNNLRAAIEQWLVSHEQATDQAIRGEQGAQAPSQAHQNKEELAVLVAATRASALMAGDSERRCAMETATITELRRKLHDTQYCKLCPGGSALSLQSRWHVLGVCLHPDLRDARMKAAKEIREVARRTFLSITDREGRLPHWELLFATNKEDQWIWPDSEQGVHARSGWQESQWWGLWGPKRMDEWAAAYFQEHKIPVSERAWGTLLRALQRVGWTAVAQCKAVWKTFCKLRAGVDAESAAKAKQVANRARHQRWRETAHQREGVRETKRAKAAADKEKARRLREVLEPTRPDRPKGWTRRLTDRAVLHWGAKRELIRQMGGSRLRLEVTAVVLTQARLALTRVQKKRNRRNARRAAKLPGEAIPPGRPPEVPDVALEGGVPAHQWGVVVEVEGVEAIVPTD